MGRRGGVRRRNAILASSGRHVINRMYANDIAKGLLAADRGQYRSFNLGTFPDADIISLYSEYRIKFIEVTYQLYTQPNNNSNFPTLYVAPQHVADVAVAPSSRDEVLQFKGVVTHQFGPSNLVFKRRFTPVVMISTSGSGKMIATSPWLSTTGDAVPHLTHVEWIDKYNVSTDNSHNIRIVAKAIVECRGTK